MTDDSLEADPEATEDAEGTEGPPTEAVVFFIIGGFSALIGIIYLVWTATTASGTELAGGAVLLGAGAFSTSIGVFLFRTARQVQADVLEAERAAEAGSTDPDLVLYLPESSIWPFVIGVGLSLVLAGIPLGFWVLIPGVALLLQGLVGFMHQSRDRRI